jgi:Mce-associated membrane protein
MTTLRDDTEAAVRDGEIVDADTDAADTEQTNPDEAETEGRDKREKRETKRGTQREKRRIEWLRVLAYGGLPALALLLALAAGYFMWVVRAADGVARARTESVRVASEDAVALLSYKPDSVDKDLGAARERLTGDFKDAYTTLTREVVIPGAKEKRITAVAKVTAAAPVSATANHAVVLLFANQTVTIGAGVPTDTQPVIRVTLDKVDGRWLVSHFDPV